MQTQLGMERQRPTTEISLKSVAFSGFTFDFATEQLRRGARLIPVRPRASRALALLLTTPGEIVSHEALRAAIWGGTIVEWKAGLHQIMRDLRKALGDSGGANVVIECVSRRGYRFRPQVRPAPPSSRGINIRTSGRDLAFLGAGVLILPLLVLAACVAIGAG